MPEQHCCFAVPGSMALCQQQLAGWWAAHSDRMPGFQKAPKWQSSWRPYPAWAVHVDGGQRLRHPPSSGGGCSPPCHCQLDGWCSISVTKCVAWWMPFLRGYSLKTLEKSVFGKDLKDSAEKSGSTCWWQGGKSMWVRGLWKKDLACEVKQAQRMLGVRR